MKETRLRVLGPALGSQSAQWYWSMTSNSSTLNFRHRTWYQVSQTSQQIQVPDSGLSSRQKRQVSCSCAITIGVQGQERGSRCSVVACSKNLMDSVYNFKPPTKCQIRRRQSPAGQSLSSFLRKVHVLGYPYSLVLPPPYPESTQRPTDSHALVALTSAPIKNDSIVAAPTTLSMLPLPMCTYFRSSSYWRERYSL